MDDVRPPLAPPSLYEADEHAWYFAQIAALRERCFGDIDADHLAEFLEDVAKRDTREIRSRLARLVQHLLKLRYQPERLSWSWVRTITVQQEHLRIIFADSATLAQRAPALLERAYADAVRAAARETRLPESQFPARCPWTIEAALAFEPPTPPGFPP